MSVRLYLYVLLCILFGNISIYSKVVIEGIDDKKIIQLIESEIISNNTEYELDDINFNADADIIINVLHNYGYLDASVKYKKQGDDIVFIVNIGNRYKIGIILLELFNTSNKFNITALQMHYLTEIPYESYLTEGKIKNSKTNIIDYFRSKGYILSDIIDIKVTKDEETKLVKIVYQVSVGPRTHIGNTIINVDDKRYGDRFIRFINNRIMWSKGDLYDEKSIIDTRDTLLETDVFRSIDIKLVEQDKSCNDGINNNKETLEQNTENNSKDIDQNNVISDVVVNASLASPNKISASATFDITNYLSTGILYKRYNVDNCGGYVQFGVNWTGVLYKNNVSTDSQIYMRDVFGKTKDLNIGLNVDVKNHKKDADEDDDSSDDVLENSEQDNNILINNNKFKSVTADICLFANVVNRISKYFSITYGISTDILSDRKRHYNILFGIPTINAVFTNTCDDKQKYFYMTNIILNNYFAKNGNFISVLSKNKILIPLITNQFYNSFSCVFGFNFGKIFSSNVINVHRKKLFYSGGSESIRGYGLKMVGDLDSTNTSSVGGTSIYEFTIEPRFRMNRFCELLAMCDLGNISFSKPFVSLGVGTRIITKYCVISVCAAFPTKIRKNKFGRRIDSLWQLSLKIEKNSVF